MAFARTDTSILNHRKFIGLDPAAIGLWTMGNAYCWDQLSDGFIPDSQLPRLLTWVHWRTLRKLAAELVARGIWHRIEGVQCAARTPHASAGGQSMTTSVTPSDPPAANPQDENPDPLTGPGWRVHDWLQWNPSAAEIKAGREAAKLRAQKSRGSRGASARTPHQPDQVQRTSRVTSRESCAARSLADVDVDVDSPPLKASPPTRRTHGTNPRAQGTNPRAPSAQGASSVSLTAEMFNRCDDGQSGFCVKTEYLAALPADLRRQCPEHQA